ENEFNSLSTNKYDFILQPSWEIEKLSKDSVDLFINKNSLGEMSDDACKNFVEHICKASRYFYHMNHDNFRNVYVDGSHGLLSSEFPITSDFSLIYRYPDLGHLLQSGRIDYYMDIFIHLYKKN
ncbi:MAG: hypothetical protein CMG07_05225, partial [Candidatus Marinimicrobia bacterium]|nr:hypothetical protein [Candidatus Neomarinimicrobiota bacterium]